MIHLNLSNKETFSSDQDARMAFYRGDLRWIPGSCAYIPECRKGTRDVEGHRSVTIRAVNGIAADGSPVYVCEDRDGQLSFVEDEWLHTRERLLLNHDGTPTVYSRWLGDQIAERERRGARRIDTPIAVTGIRRVSS